MNPEARRAYNRAWTLRTKTDKGMGTKSAGASPNMGIVFICKVCSFVSHDEGKALAHKSPIHQMHKFTEELL